VAAVDEPVTLDDALDDAVTLDDALTLEETLDTTALEEVPPPTLDTSTVDDVAPPTPRPGSPKTLLSMLHAAGRRPKDAKKRSRIP
jgi:hypothetical protein